MNNNIQTLYALQLKDMFSQMDKHSDVWYINASNLDTRAHVQKVYIDLGYPSYSVKPDLVKRITVELTRRIREQE